MGQKVAVNPEGSLVASACRNVGEEYSVILTSFDSDGKAIMKAPEITTAPFNTNF